MVAAGGTGVFCGVPPLSPGVTVNAGVFVDVGVGVVVRERLNVPGSNGMRTMSAME